MAGQSSASCANEAPYPGTGKACAELNGQRMIGRRHHERWGKYLNPKAMHGAHRAGVNMALTRPAEFTTQRSAGGYRYGLVCVGKTLVSVEENSNRKSHSLGTLRPSTSGGVKTHRRAT